MDADLVLLAMGFTGPVKNGLLDSLGVNYDARGNVSVDENFMTSQDGIFAAGDSTVNLSNVTIFNNIADSDQDGSGDGGGIKIRAAATANAKNTIIAGNSRGDGATSDDCFGTLNSQGHNLIGDTSGCTIIGDTTGNITGQDPLLAPLQNVGFLPPPSIPGRPLQNVGGPTETHLLQSLSPAIDNGSPDCPPPDTDQRGTVRPQGAACDIGAFERAPTDPIP